MVIAIDIRLIGKKRTGDEAVFRALTKALIRTESEAMILLLTDEVDPDVIVRLGVELGIGEKKNVEIISLPSPNRYVWNFLTVPRFLRERQVDIFHTQYILPFFVPKRTKLFAHIHDISFKVFPELIGWKDRLFLSLLIPRTMRIADRILAVSEFTKAEIVERYCVSEERIVVVPNAVDDAFSVRATIDDVANVRRKYSLPQTFVLAVGTMQPRKNIAFLIRVFAEVKRRLPELELVLVGKRYGYRYDKDIDTALKDCRVAEAVLFPGYVEDRDMPAMYAAARVFAFPSEYEGFGIPLLEAFSQGTPTVASDIPPFHEVGGDATVFFDGRGDIARAAEILYNVVIDENMRLRFSERGENRAKFFSWEKSARILRDLFRKRVNH
jgi:glycosyltransferase involved in cell wall biosynthesis